MFGPLYLRRRNKVLILYEAGWAPGPVWTGAENPASTGISYPGRPFRIESLYRLSYSSPHRALTLLRTRQLEYQVKVKRTLLVYLNRKQRIRGGWGKLKMLIKAMLPAVQGHNLGQCFVHAINNYEICTWVVVKTRERRRPLANPRTKFSFSSTQNIANFLWSYTEMGNDSNAVPKQGTGGWERETPKKE
jgi:hypothetical protein